MEGLGRGREHFNHAFRWLTFDQDRKVVARYSGHEQRVYRSQRDFKYRAAVAAALA
jgi:hypothetical protein